MQCPNCSEDVGPDDWFCPYCAEALQTEDDIQAVLSSKTFDPSGLPDDTIVEGDDTVETTDGSGDALILGELPDDGQDLLDVDTLAGLVTDGDGHTSSYLLYTNQVSTRALRPDAVPHRTGEIPRSALTPLEHHLYRRVDGQRTLADIGQDGLAGDRELTVAFLVLMDRGLVHFGEAAAAPPPPAPLASPPPSPPPVLDANLLTELDPTPAPAERRRPDPARRLYEAAIKDRNAQNLESAKKNLELALAFDPDLEAARILQLELQRCGASTPAPAEPRFPRARQLYREAEAREIAKDTDGAIAKLREALDEEEEPMILNRLAVILALRKRELAEARALLERAVHLAPENRAYVHNLGKILGFIAQAEPVEAGPGENARRSLWRRLLGKDG